MARKGKKQRKARESIGLSQRYDFTEGVRLALECSYARFDESVDLAIRLGVDPRRADQMVRGTVVLPNGTGKSVRVLAFAKGEKEKEAREAGADHAGGEEMIEKIKKGWLEFDKTVATPDMMGAVGKIGKILGPRGLMPNAKLGTVTFDLAKVVNEIKAGKIDFRVEKSGIVHAAVGRVSFGADKILENIATFLDTIIRHKPAASKGTYIRSVAVSTTMGPGIKIDPASVKSLLQ